MGLSILILGLLVFLAPHTLTVVRGPRQQVVDAIGLGPYKGLYSLISLVGIVLIVWGFGLYRATGWIDVWHPPGWTRHVAVALMWPACICLVAAYVRGDIYRVLKHPMLVGIKLWALAHLIANGDLGSILLFGGFLAWAVFDRISLKRRTDPGTIPMPLGGRRNDAIAIAVGTVLYALLGLYFHPYAIGVPVFTR